MIEDMDRSEELEREVGDDSAAYEADEELMSLLDEESEDICEDCGGVLDLDGYCSTCEGCCEHCGNDMVHGVCYHCDYDDVEESFEDDDEPVIRRMRKSDD